MDDGTPFSGTIVTTSGQAPNLSNTIIEAIVSTSIKYNGGIREPPEPYTDWFDYWRSEDIPMPQLKDYSLTANVQVGWACETTDEGHVCTSATCTQIRAYGSLTLDPELHFEVSFKLVFRNGWEQRTSPIAALKGRVTNANWHKTLCNMFNVAEGIRNYNSSVASHLAQQVLDQARDNGEFTCRESYDSYFEKPNEWQKMYRDLFCGGIPCDENEQVEFLIYAETSQYDSQEDEVLDGERGI